MRIRDLVILTAAFVTFGCERNDPDASAASSAAAPAESAPPAADRSTPGTDGPDATAESGPATTPSERPARDGDDAAAATSAAGYATLSPPQPTSTPSEHVEIAAFFSYACEPCYRFEADLEQWQAAQPDYVNFIRMPRVSDAASELHARAFLAADATGKLDEIHAAMFEAIHNGDSALETRAAIAALFERFGVSAAQLERALDSYATDAKLRRAEELALRYGVTSAPSLVVNGKYRTTPELAGGREAMLDVAGDLAADELAASGAASEAQ